MSKPYSLLLPVSFFVVLFFSVFASVYADQSARGFAWSANTGWLSFSSINCDANDDARSEGAPSACPSAGTGMARYGVNVSGGAADITRNFSGFAWSPYIGWVSFNQNDLAGCPTGTCNAQIVNNAVAGWSRAIANNPGWSGWIHLANASPAYGPVLGSDNKFRGFSWGENVIGWLKWDPNGGGVYLYGGSEMRVIKNGNGMVASAPAGIDCGNDCSEAYDPGTVVTLTETELPGYRFASWGGAGASCGTATICQVTMGTSETVVTITFDPILEVTRSGNGTVTSSPTGINCGVTCSKSYPSGTSVTLTAIPDSGYRFVGWSGAGTSCGTNTTCTLSVTGYTSVLATFSSDGALIVTRSGNGAVASSDGRIRCGGTCESGYANGTTVTLRAQPDLGHVVGSWGGAASSCGSAITCAVTINGTTNVSITFVRGRIGDPPPGGSRYRCSDNIDNDLDGKCDFGTPGTSKMCLDPATGVVSLMPVDFPECNSATKNSETVSGTVVEY